MRTLLRIALCGCVLVALAPAQRGGGGARGGGFHGGGGGVRIGGGGGGFRGGGIGGGGGFRGTGGGYRGIGGGYRGYGYRGYGYRGYGGWGYGGWGWGGYYGWPYYGYYGLGLSWGPGYYGYDFDSDYGYGYSPYSYGSYASYYPAYQPSSNVVVVYPQQAQTSTPVYVQQAQPALHQYDEYGQEVRPAPVPSAPQAAAPSGEPPLYLIAFQTGEIRAAVAYWVDGATLHYVTREHQERQAPLGSVDRAFSLRLNRERHVAFSLPAAR